MASAPQRTSVGTRSTASPICFFFLSAIFYLLFAPGPARAELPWQTALAQMPLGTNVTQLNRTNCVDLLLHAFQSNATVKALIFMPGATDEFYFFRRAQARLTNSSPSLLDAVSALTNQTLIRATFEPPLLLLHTAEDPLQPEITLLDAPTVDKLKQAHFAPHALFNDRDWDYLLPILQETLHVELLPQQYSDESWHFYRHSFAAWNLSGWEALRACAMAGKTRFTVRPNQVVFQTDRRHLITPKVESWPR